MNSSEEINASSAPLTKPKKESKKSPVPPVKTDPIPPAEIHPAMGAMPALNTKEHTRQLFIQQEVDRLWRPPVGVPPGTSCRVSFTIDKMGKVTKSAFEKRSSYVIYDLSVMQVAKQFTFDRSLWASSFTIDFTQ